MSDSDEVIASAQNAALKRVRAALRGKEPGAVVLEGRRLVEDALAAGLELEVVLVEERVAAQAPAGARLVKDGLLEGLGGVKTSPGIVALASAPPARGLDALEARCAGEEPLLLAVVAGVADPGNLGALARSAEAFGCDALVVVAGGARPMGPKALRGSMGSLLRLDVHEAPDAASLAALLERAGVTSFTAATRGGASLWELRVPARAALWITGETGAGVDGVAGLQGVTIPMAGEVESLNAAVAGALLLHEAARQRAESGR